jgi:uncharacterized protein with NRDE domain
MCLVFIAFQTVGDERLKIGANREESLFRPTTSPVCCKRGGMRCLLAGADHGPDGTFPKMGTWLGVNQAGMAVAVTNRHDGELARADQVRSRGLLAIELLGYSVPEQAARFARSELARGGFGGCNYLLADRDDALVVSAPGPGRVSVVRLGPGAHAMTNLELDDGADPRIERVRSELDSRDFVASAQRLCRDQRIVVSGAQRGTVSSTIIVSGRDIVMYHALGNPSNGEYKRYLLVGPTE